MRCSGNVNTAIIVWVSIGLYFWISPVIYLIFKRLSVIINITHLFIKYLSVCKLYKSYYSFERVKNGNNVKLDL